MSYTYEQRKRPQAQQRQATKPAAAPGPSMDALRSGLAAPTSAQMGHRVDLPEAMRMKMENAFGADLSAVKLYESQTVADAGAEAVTRGSDIAFAPGALDFTSHGGQALLGHELSHVVSQARGEVTGGGFLNSQTLEARADREGALAASGQQIYSAPMVTGALSAATAASAAGPMQASKPQELTDEEKEKNQSLKDADRYAMIVGALQTGTKISKKDRKWKDKMDRTHPEQFVKALAQRRLESLQRLMDTRKSMKDEDSEIADFKARNSAESAENMLYDNAFMGMMNMQMDWAYDKKGKRRYISDDEGDNDEKKSVRAYEESLLQQMPELRGKQNEVNFNWAHYNSKNQNFLEYKKLEGDQFEKDSLAKTYADWINRYKKGKFGSYTR